MIRDMVITPSSPKPVQEKREEACHARKERDVRRDFSD
jgi:hypothetical protein